MKLYIVKAGKHMLVTEEKSASNKTLTSFIPDKAMVFREYELVQTILDQNQYHFRFKNREYYVNIDDVLVINK